LLFLLIYLSITADVFFYNITCVRFSFAPEGYYSTLPKSLSSTSPKAESENNWPAAAGTITTLPLAKGT